MDWHMATQGAAQSTAVLFTAPLLFAPPFVRETDHPSEENEVLITLSEELIQDSPGPSFANLEGLPESSRHKKTHGMWVAPAYLP